MGRMFVAGRFTSGALLALSQYARTIFANSTKFSKSSGFTRNEFAPNWYTRLTSRIASDDVSTTTGMLPNPGCRLIHRTR